MGKLLSHICVPQILDLELVISQGCRCGAYYVSWVGRYLSVEKWKAD